jgi:FtsZ-interacting cell division protein YlmF
MAAALVEKILNFVGFYDTPYPPPQQEEAYESVEHDYDADYSEDYDHNGGTLNEQLRNQVNGRASGGNGVGGGRAGAKAGANNSGNSGSSSNTSNVVNLPHKAPNYVLVSAKPDRMEDAQLVCDHLKERHVVIVNVEGLEGREAQRIVDFIGGSVYALDGEIFDITNRIFAVAPNYVDLVSIQRDTKNRGFLSFGNSGNYGRG